jgi:YebC/PmpR family DNA-binding regulatory protein
MGRFPSIAASKAKTGAAKGKLYSMYAREIYDKAKKGGSASPESNFALKQVIEKAKKEQVPADIIKRALDKFNSGAGEDYQVVRYEIIGPNGATLIAECLTDNVNRSISDVRTQVNKAKMKMGAMNSVSYNYDNLAVVTFKADNEEDALMALLDEGIEVLDDEYSDGNLTISVAPTDQHKMHLCLSNLYPDIDYLIDEVGMYPKEKVTLTGEDKELFERLLTLLDDVEDVKTVYHNVEL